MLSLQWDDSSNHRKSCKESFRERVVSGQARMEIWRRYTGVGCCKSFPLVWLRLFFCPPKLNHNPRFLLSEVSAASGTVLLSCCWCCCCWCDGRLLLRSSRSMFTSSAAWAWVKAWLRLWTLLVLGFFGRARLLCAAFHASSRVLLETRKPACMSPATSCRSLLSASSHLIFSSCVLLAKT